MSGPRRWRFIAAGTIFAAVLLGGTFGWLWSAVRPPVYAGTATLMVQTTAPLRQSYDAVRGDVVRAPVIAALSVAPPRIAQVADALGLEHSSADLARQVNARNERGTPFIAITARASDPTAAAQFANGLAELAVASGGDPSDDSATRIAIVEPAVPPVQPAYSRAPLSIATGALALGSLAAAVVVVARGRRLPPVLQPARTRSPREIGVGVGLGIIIVASLAIGAPEEVSHALTLLGAGLAVVSPAAGLALLALLFPLPDGYPFGPITLQLLVIGGFTFGTILDAAVRRDVPRIGLGTLAVLFYIGLAMVASAPVLNGLDGERLVASLARFLQLGAGLLLVLVAAFHFGRHDPRPYVMLTVVSAAFAATLAIAQLLAVDPTGLPFQGLYPPTEAINVVRPSGPFVNANYFGLFMALGLVAAMGSWWIMPRLRLLLAVCVLPMAFALTSGSLSRGALLAVVAGVLTLVWTRSRPRIALLATIGMLAMAAILYPLLLDARVTRTEVGTTADTEAGVAASDEERFDSVAAALPLFGIDPIFGVGFGQYHFESTHYVGSSTATSSHNQYLNILAEQGVVGIAALAALLAALIAGLIRARSEISRLGIAMLATYAVAGLVLEPLNTLQTSGTLWLVLGAGLVPATSRQAAPASAESAPQPARAAQPGIVEAIT